MFSLALLVAAPLAGAAISAPSSNVAWLPAAADADVDRAFAQARAQNKPVLMYWGATWCPPCNQLKATFFNRQDFAQASRGFVAVHVDGDRPGAQKIGTRFKVSGYPTVVLFGAGGAEITRLPGEVDPDSMMAVLQQGMAGGRAVAEVLADARAGKALTAGEWRMLAFYSWATDEQRLVSRADLPALMAQLAVAAPAADPDTATRLWLKAVAASDEGKGLKADAALRERVQRVLADPAQARKHADVLSNEAPEIVRALSDEDSAERAPLVAAYAAALRRLETDAGLSRGDRIGALIARIQLARLGQPKEAVQVDVPASLIAEVKAHVSRDDREITDGYERQAVITAAAYALGQIGQWEDSDALLKANLARSHSPYYLMSQLGGNARKRGQTQQALQWYGEAFAKSEGPATRLQWGTSYLLALVDLAPQDAPRIERTAAQLIGEAGKDSGAFSGRSARSLQRLGQKLVSWNADGKQAATLQRLQRQLDGVCRKVETGERAACQGLLKPAPKAA
jgi:thioredoxin-like negative regulator of GroEL